VKIFEEYESRKESNQSASSQSAMIAQKHVQKRNKNKKDKPEKVDSQNQKAKVKCFKCHKFGHMIKDCDLNKKSQLSDKNTKDTDNVSLYVESNVNGHDETLQTNKESNCGTWCFDSGCTSHMCNDVDVFKDINSCGHGKFKLVNDACAKIEAMGIKRN